MKYKLLKPLPWIEVWTILKELEDVHPFWNGCVSRTFATKYPDFFEEVKEIKSIYDLKEGDEYWRIYDDNYIERQKYQNKVWSNEAIYRCFLTEREAKRHKLLRELATRLDKWLPEEWEVYLTIWWELIPYWSEWKWYSFEYLAYHAWLVFCNSDEFNKWITDEARDLLFNP